MGSTLLGETPQIAVRERLLPDEDNDIEADRAPRSYNDDANRHLMDGSNELPSEVRRPERMEGGRREPFYTWMVRACTLGKESKVD